MTDTIVAKQLALQNWKSYKGDHVVGPFTHNFTAVIGPNGSGKSNIMDAICFVLGVQAPSLRAGQLRELVFRESDSSEPEDLPCSVTLVLGERDNSRSDVTLRRAIVKGAAQYFINGKKTTAAKYDDQLAEFNILKRAKNFLVCQGDVASIGGVSGSAASQQMVLTKLFEQVSGSAELEARYEELRVAKEKAEEATVLNFQKKRGMDAEKKQFKEQDAEAQRYRELLEQQQALKQEQMLFEISFVNGQVGELKDQLAVVRSGLSEAEAELQRATKDLATADKDLGKAKRLRLQQDGALASKLKEHMKLNPALIELRKQVEHLSKKIERSRDKEGALLREQEAQQEELTQLNQQLFELQQSRKEWEAEVARQEAQSRSVALDAAQLEQYTILKEEATRASHVESGRLGDARTSHMLKREELASLEARRDALARRRADLEQDERALVARMEQQTAQADEARRAIAELEQALRAGEERRVEATRERDQLTEALQGMQEQLRDEKMDRKQSERDARFQQTLEALKRLHPGVRGRLVDLVEPRQRKHQAACAVAMGRHMDAIVVDDRATAVECLQYMKTQRVGVATFLPLDSIQATTPPERLRSLGGSAKLVCDVLQFDKAVEKAVLYAVGSCMVCDTDAEAKELCYGRERVKAVTVAGTVYHKSGVVTGGVASGASKWTRAKLEALKKRRDEHITQLDRLAHELRAHANTEEVQTKIASLSVRLRTTDVDLAQTRSKLDAIRGELDTVDRDASAVVPLVAEARAECDKLQRAVEAGERAVREREDAIFAPFCKKIGVRSVAQYEAEAVAVARARNERRLQFSAQEARISAAIEYGRSRDVHMQRKAAQEASQGDEKQLAAVKKRLVAATKEESSMLEQLESLKASVAERKALEETADAAVRAARQARTQKAAAVADRTSAAATVESTLRALQSRRHAVLRRAAVEEVHLPTESGPMEIEGEEFREAEGSQSQVQVFEQEDEMNFDFSDLRKALHKVRSEAEFNALLAEMQQELATVTMQLSRMNPNLKAVDKLREVQGRLGEIEEGLKEARREGQTVAQQFEEVRAERMKRFMDCFQHVSSKIEEVYDALTRPASRRDSAVPVAGKAFLTLQDINTPWSAGITYQTIPPSKRLFNFEQLSGGEKSLASLALIFAIHSFSPSPFFVLDEIDAALDPQNVEQLARYVQQHAVSNQFIVITLKDSVYSHADALVGVYKDMDAKCSRMLTVDLAGREY